jgi:signal peptidase II
MRARFLAITMVVVALDQLTKAVVVRALAEGDSRPVIDDILRLSHVRNSGAAFSLFPGLPGLFVLAGIAGVVFFAVLLARRPGALIGSAAALVAGGALGNLVDRLTRGRVVDFVDFRYWPAFNVADAAVSVGAGLLLLASFKEKNGKRADGR